MFFREKRGGLRVEPSLHRSLRRTEDGSDYESCNNNENNEDHYRFQKAQFFFPVRLVHDEQSFYSESVLEYYSA
jgi:hypothetical protein